MVKVGEAMSYRRNAVRQSEILEPVEAFMIVSPPVKIRTSDVNVEYSKKEDEST